MKITIIGAGNAGLAHGVLIAKEGHSVTIVKTTHLKHEDSFNILFKTRKIEYEMSYCRGVVMIDNATRDIQSAVSGAEVILVLTQSVAHENISKLISPYLHDGQIVLIAPGYAGSFYFSTKCRDKNVIFAEGESLSIDSRIISPGRVKILFENIRNPIGVFPSMKTEETLSVLRKVLPNLTARQNVVESAFHNPNLIVHTIGAIMSVSRIEYSHGEFWMYREGFSPSIWNLMESLDAEKNLILDYFGLTSQSFAKSFQFRTSEDLDADPMEAFLNYAKSGSPKGPSDSQTRYITEDVPMGLCFLSSIGKKVNFPTPTCNALIAISSSIHNKDYFGMGRTLENLGIGQFSLKDLQKILKFGFSKEKVA